MTALNHAATGALVAVAIGDPLIALPAALLSHFLIDMLPHWDYYRLTEDKSRGWLNPAIDFGASLFLLLILAMTVNAPAWLLITGGLLGVLPDMMWVSYIIWHRPSIQGNKSSLLNRVRHFHLKIQWLETTKLVGLFAELAWFGLMIFLIYQVN